MPRTIIKIKDRYFEWSTVVDAPVTPGMTLDAFKTYYRREYGESGMGDLSAWLERVEATGTSSMIDDSMRQVISCNRAGADEKYLTADEIYKHYTDDGSAEDIADE